MRPLLIRSLVVPAFAVGIAGAMGPLPVFAQANAGQAAGAPRPPFALRAEQDVNINLDKDTAIANEERAHDQIAASIDQHEDLENVNYKKRLEALPRTYPDPDLREAQRKAADRDHQNMLNQIKRDRALEGERHAQKLAEIAGRFLKGAISKSESVAPIVLQPQVPKLDPRGLPSGSSGSPAPGGSQSPGSGNPSQASLDVRGKLLPKLPETNPLAPGSGPSGGSSNIPLPQPDGDIPQASPEIRLVLGVTEGVKQVLEDYAKTLPQNLRDQIIKKYGPNWLQRFQRFAEVNDKLKTLLQNVKAAGEPTGQNPYQVGLQLGRDLGNEYKAALL